jgi:hypothetical protein
MISAIAVPSFMPLPIALADVWPQPIRTWNRNSATGKACAASLWEALICIPTGYCGCRYLIAGMALQPNADVSIKLF